MLIFSAGYKLPIFKNYYLETKEVKAGLKTVRAKVSMVELQAFVPTNFEGRTRIEGGNSNTKYQNTSPETEVIKGKDHVGCQFSSLLGWVREA